MKNNISKKSLASILESSKDSIIIANQEGRIVSWNNSSSLLFGYSPEEAMGQKLDIIIPKEMHDAHHEGMSRFMSTGIKKIIDQTITLDGQKKDGTIVPIELSLSSWEEESKEKFVCAIIRNISERREKDRQIIDLHGIINSSPSCNPLPFTCA